MPNYAAAAHFRVAKFELTQLSRWNLHNLGHFVQLYAGQPLAANFQFAARFEVGWQGDGPWWGRHGRRSNREAGDGKRNQLIRYQVWESM